MSDYLKLENISESFENGALVLFDNLCLTAPEGRSLSVTGKSGTGKSTLLHIAAGLIKPTAGKVYWNGEDINSLSDSRLSAIRAREVGFIFQNNLLLNDFSPVENIIVPALIAGVKKETAVAKAKELLCEVGLKDKVYLKNINTLSGGEKQRIAVCRALVNSPRIVFADEPTGSLDESNRAVVEELLFRLVKTEGCSLFLVTHDADFASSCDVRYLLRNRMLEEA